MTEPLSDRMRIARDVEHCAWCPELIHKGKTYMEVALVIGLERHYHPECYAVADFGCEDIHAHHRGRNERID